MDLQLTGILKTCEECALDKSKNAGVHKLPLKHWLLVLKSSTNYAWNYIFERKVGIEGFDVGIVERFEVNTRY